MPDSRVESRTRPVDAAGAAGLMDGAHDRAATALGRRHNGRRRPTVPWKTGHERPSGSHSAHRSRLRRQVNAR